MAHTRRRRFAAIFVNPRRRPARRRVSFRRRRANPPKGYSYEGRKGYKLLLHRYGKGKKARVAGTVTKVGGRAVFSKLGAAEYATKFKGKRKSAAKKLQTSPYWGRKTWSKSKKSYGAKPAKTKSAKKRVGTKAASGEGKAKRSRKTTATVATAPTKLKARKHAKANPRRRVSRRLHARRNPLFVSNPRRRKSRRHARRNPLFAMRNPLFIRNPGQAMLSELPVVGGLVQSALGVLSQVPFAGGFLASAGSLIVPAALGAVALEIPIRAQAQVAGLTFVPAQLKDQKVYFVLSGALLGAGTAMLLKRMGKPELAKALGLSIASAAAGAAYYHYRIEQSCEAAGLPTPSETAAAAAGTAEGGDAKPAGELAGLGALLTAGFGMGPAYSVEENDFSGPTPYGALLTGA